MVGECICEDPPIARRLSPLVAGLLLALAVPPWGFWILAPVGVALAAWALEGRGVRGRALVGLLLGIGQFAPTLFWMSEFQAVGYAAVVLLETSFFVAAFALTPARRAALAVPAAFVLAEWARGEWPFGGLPMGGVPLGVVASPIAPAARLGGGLLLLGVTAAVGTALLSVPRRRWRQAGALAAGAVLVVVAGALSFDGTPGDSLRVVFVQGGGERGFRAVDTDPSIVFEAHVAASELIEGPVDLVVWPENVIDVGTQLRGTPQDRVIGELARSLNATIVAGVTQDVEPDNFLNAAVAWTPDGGIADRYTKVHRVPFGEYVPGRAIFERLADLSVIPRDAVAGRGEGVLETPVGRLGVAISYEVFFGDRGRSAAGNGGRVLLIPTNAASFSSTQVPGQEIGASQLQAWATARDVVQTAPTGFGAFVDHEGRVTGRTALSERAVVPGTMTMRTGETVYVRFGDAPIVLLAALALAAGWVRRPSRR